MTKSTTHGFSGKIRLLIEIVIAGIAVAIFMGIGDKSISSALAVPFSLLVASRIPEVLYE